MKTFNFEPDLTFSITIPAVQIEGGSFDPLDEAPGDFVFQYVCANEEDTPAKAKIRVFGEVTIPRAAVEAEVGRAFASIQARPLAQALKKLLRQAIKAQILDTTRKEPSP